MESEKVGWKQEVVNVVKRRKRQYTIRHKVSININVKLLISESHTNQDNSVSRSYFYHLCQFRSIRRSLSLHTTSTLVHAMICTWEFGLSSSTLLNFSCGSGCQTGAVQIRQHLQPMQCSQALLPGMGTTSVPEHTILLSK